MATSDVTLIQCTNTKRNHPALAWDLYDPSAYFRAQREWALARQSRYGDPWFILSGKHGLLDPRAAVRDYNAVGLSESQSADIAATLSDMGIETAHVHAGRKYTGTLTPALEGAGIDVVEHCAGDPIGVRRSKLREKTAALGHATL